MFTNLTTLSGTLSLLGYLLGSVIIFYHLFGGQIGGYQGNQAASRSKKDQNTNGYTAPAQGIFSNAKHTKVGVLLPGGLAAILNLYYSAHHLILAEGFNFSLFPILSLASAFMVIVTIIFSIRRPFENIMIVVYPIAALMLLLSLAFKSHYLLHSNYSAPILLHIALSLLAYSLLAIAFAQALLILGQNHQLKHKHLAGIIRILPPLQLMEQILFGLLWGGVVLLTLSIATGLLFFENFFVQKLAHKTFFTLLAWGIFTTLLLGRYRAGWRGLTAVRWSIGGFILLAIGFVGTKLVLEYILIR